MNNSYPYTTFVGNTFRLRTVIVNSDRTPVDLTGATMRADIVARPGSPALKIFAITPDGAPNAGAVWLEVAASLTPGVYYFDLLVTFPSGQSLTFLGGSSLTIKPAATVTT